MSGRESLYAAAREGQCHWPIQGCHVWSYVMMPSGNDLPREGDPCRCGETTWTRRTAVYEDCGCVTHCGEGDPEGPGVCKGLPNPPREPLVEIVLVHRDDRV